MDPQPSISVGLTLHDVRGRRIGRVEAVFADYLLVRTAGIPPIDLYVPRPEVRSGNGRLAVGIDRHEAERLWHRPLKRAPHD